MPPKKANTTEGGPPKPWTRRLTHQRRVYGVLGLSLGCDQWQRPSVPSKRPGIARDVFCIKCFVHGTQAKKLRSKNQRLEKYSTYYVSFVSFCLKIGYNRNPATNPAMNPPQNQASRQFFFTKLSGDLSQIHRSGVGPKKWGWGSSGIWYQITREMLTNENYRKF